MNHSNSDSVAAHQPPAPSGRRWPWLVLVLGILIGLGSAYYFGVPWLLARLRSEPVVIASFQEDFQTGRPKNGWRYLWNANGPIGCLTNYAELQWDGGRYQVEGGAGYPAPPPAKFLRITRGADHPGQGFGQGVREVGNELARFAIVAFTVPARGHYVISRSRIARTYGLLGGAIELRVFVNDREKGAPLSCRSPEGLSFDRALGKLSAGDTIYVAVGPGETDSDNAFDLDFAVAF